MAIQRSRPIQIRGNGVFRHGPRDLALVQYELWHLHPPPGAVVLRDRQRWSGTATVLELLASWPLAEPVWLHLLDDSYRLSVGLAGSGPRYILVGLTGLEPDR
jgi:hypothetical protein